MNPGRSNSCDPMCRLAIARVVRKLMAKKPEDRYQTPGEAATALASAFKPGGGLAGGVDRTMAEGRPAADAAETSGDTLASPFASLITEPGESAALEGLHPKVDLGRLLLYLVAGASVFLVGVVLLVSHFWKEPARTTPTVKGEEPSIVAKPPPKPKSNDDWLEEVVALPAEEQVKAVAARLKERNPDFDGKVTHKVEDGVVTELTFLTDQVTDISPVRALTGLRTFRCDGSPGKRQHQDPGMGRLSTCRR